MSFRNLWMSWGHFRKSLVYYFSTSEDLVSPSETREIGVSSNFAECTIKVRKICSVSFQGDRGVQGFPGLAGTAGEEVCDTLFVCSKRKAACSVLSLEDMFITLTFIITLHSNREMMACAVTKVHQGVKDRL